MKTLYTGIIDRLTAKAPAIKDIDLYNAQFEFEDIQRPITYPAVFVEFADVAWESQTSTATHRHQRGNYVLRLYVAQETYGETDSRSVDRVNALQMFDVLDEVAAALMGWSPQGYTAFQRVRTTVQAVYGELSVYTMEFRTEGSECIERVDANYTAAEPELVVKGEYDEERDGVDSRPERPESPFILPE